MKYAIFSDIHRNFPALMTFFAATEDKVDHYLCLGDIVQDGTSFDDHRCIELVKQHHPSAVRGNHEDRVFENYNKSKRKISLENLEYIASLPLELIIGKFYLIHAPSGKRIVTPEQSEDEFQTFSESQICFFGHSHKAIVLSKDKKGKIKEEKFERKILLRPELRYMINPGGVGVYWGLPQTYLLYDDQSRQLEFKSTI